MSVTNTARNLDHVVRKPEVQKRIYYITGQSMAEVPVKNLPHLEKLKKKGFDSEVLYLVEPIDEYFVTRLKEFNGKQLICIMKERLELESAEEEKKEEANWQAEFEELCKVVKDMHSGKVEKAVLSKMLVDSPCAITTSQFGWSAKNGARHDCAGPPRLVEEDVRAQPENGVIKVLKEKVAEGNLKANESVRDLAYLFDETAHLTFGFVIDEPASLANRIHKMVSLGLDTRDDEPKEAPAAETTLTSAMEEID